MNTSSMIIPISEYVPVQQLSAALELPDAVMYGVADATYAVFGPAMTLFEQGLTAAFPALVAFLNDYSESNRFATRKPLPLTRLVDGLFCVTFYFVALAVLYVVGKVFGKRKYKALGIVHNTHLFLLSLYMFIAYLATSCALLPRPWNVAVGNETDDDWRMAKLTWLFMVSKLPEYGDTFLMMLKQNYHQVSFLHLYHHVSIFLYVHVVTNESPGGDCYFSSMVNCGVHVVMYGYYAGTMIFNDGPVRKFLNSIKFMITKGQMTQFTCNFLQGVWVLSCDELRYPRKLVLFQMGYMMSMLALFGNFLIKGQMKARSTSASPASPASPIAARDNKKRQ